MLHVGCFHLAEVILCQLLSKLFTFEGRYVDSQLAFYFLFFTKLQEFCRHNRFLKSFRLSGGDESSIELGSMRDH